MYHSLKFAVRRFSASGRVFLFILVFPVLQATTPAPDLFVFSLIKLEKSRAALDRGDVTLQPAFRQLMREADAALKQKPESVMDKTGIAASGDKHDYFSYGPYWWPDPTKPDGRPYIRRDGEINPASKKGTDNHPFVRTSEAIETLSLAYFFTKQESYADQAALLARVWYLDDATRMKPNLDYAQALPGINNGRGIGIIEVRSLIHVADSLALLQSSSAWKPTDQSAFRAWLGDYYQWLTTSRNGIDEQDELNNHGSWYDVQAAYLALALDRKDEAKKILATGLKLRLAAQIDPSGTQPRELARTKSLEYSLFNLEALMICAGLADHAGVDWWNFVTADGRSLHAALAYLAPYVDPAKPWPKQDLVNPERGRLLPLFSFYLTHREDAQFRTLLEQFSSADSKGRWRLLQSEP